jgi:hypothetical protein
MQCRPGWPETHDFLVSASEVLELQACTTMPGSLLLFRKKKENNFRQ